MIDTALVQAGWTRQSRDTLNLAAARGMAERELRIKDGHPERSELGVAE